MTPFGWLRRKRESNSNKEPHKQKFPRETAQESDGDDWHSEVEDITTKLIQETKEKMDVLFSEQTLHFANVSFTQYDDSTPKLLTRENAKSIIDSLLKTAVSSRALLSERIAVCADNSTQSRCAKKLGRIRDLSTVAEIKKREMRRARERYEQSWQIYKKVVESVYKKDFRPGEPSDFSDKDVWVDMKEEKQED